MAKYDPLQRYLARQKTARVELTFTDIERMIGAFLPKAAGRPQWWTEIEADVPPAVQVQAWRSAGYRARLTDGERVVFERS
jgi:hypothetical protein